MAKTSSLSTAAQWIESRRSTWKGTTRIPPARPISDLGATVADLLAHVFHGIHNAPINHEKPEWWDRQYIEATVYGPMSTYDDDKLTRLVLRCHDLAVRCEIRGCGPGYLRLGFSQRVREGDICRAHPTMEQSIERLRPAKAEATR